MAPQNTRPRQPGILNFRLAPAVFQVLGYILSTPDWRHVPRDPGSRSDLHEINLLKKFHLRYSSCKFNFDYKKANVKPMANTSWNFKPKIRNSHSSHCFPRYISNHFAIMYYRPWCTFGITLLLNMKTMQFSLKDKTLILTEIPLPPSSQYWCHLSVKVIAT